MRYIFSILAFFILSLVSYSQSENNNLSIYENLRVSDDQLKELSVLEDRFDKLISSIERNDELTSEQKKEQLEGLNEKKHEEVKSIIANEQISTYIILVAEKEAEEKLNIIYSEVGLTESEINALKTIKSGMENKVGEINKNTELNKYEKRDQRNEIYREASTKIQALMTEDQYRILTKLQSTKG